MFFLSNKGGDVVTIAQRANIAGNQNRISQPETPVTLQFQGNKFTLSPSQLRQLTTGQPLQLQGTLGNVHSIVTLFPLNFFFHFSGILTFSCNSPARKRTKYFSLRFFFGLTGVKVTIIICLSDFNVDKHSISALMNHISKQIQQQWVKIIVR